MLKKATCFVLVLSGPQKHTDPEISSQRSSVFTCSMDIKSGNGKTTPNKSFWEAPPTGQAVC